MFSESPPLKRKNCDRLPFKRKPMTGSLYRVRLRLRESPDRFYPEQFPNPEVAAGMPIW